MKNTLVIIAELGCLKAYKLENGELNRTPRLELLEHYTNNKAKERLVEQVSDSSGRFGRGGMKSNSAGGMGDGERHNIQLEQRKRLVREIAKRLNALAKPREIERCLLAASREINNQLIAELDPAVRAKIEKNLSADLTKIETAQLLNHF
jgi:hypothetical protein